jgi:hypothetical protein
MPGAKFYSGYILLIQSNDSREKALLKSELLRFSWMTLGTIIPLSLIVYFRSRKIIKPIKTLNEKVRIKRAHETLYKTPALISWMRENHAFRFSLSGDHLYVSRKSSHHDWVMVDSCVNDLVTFLLSQGFKTDHQISATVNNIAGKINYYWIQYDIKIEGSINEVEMRFIFNNKSALIIECLIPEFNEWQFLAEYDYMDKEITLINILTTDILNVSSFQKLYDNKILELERQSV